MGDKELEGGAAPQRAVEIDEQTPDATDRGLNFTRPTESLSINYIGLESDEQGKQNLAAGGGPHVVPEKGVLKGPARRGSIPPLHVETEGTRR